MVVWYVIIAIGIVLNFLVFLIGGNKHWGK